MFSSFASKIWQILTAIFAGLTALLYLGKLKADRKTLEAERDKALLEAEQARKDATQATAVIKESERQNTLTEQAQEAINEATEGKVSTETLPPVKKPRRGLKGTLGVFLLFMLISCAPKVVKEVEYVTVKPNLPYLNVIDVPVFKPVPWEVIDDNGTTCFAYDDVMAIQAHLDALKDVIERGNKQVEIYNEFRKELLK
jgi:hypothetical protein